MEAMDNKSHYLQIFGEERLETNAVKEILSSTEREVIVQLEGNVMTISGSGLTILKLIPENGELAVKGKIESIRYATKATKKSFLKRVFK